jgi:ABC-type glycerol-3-phosphate transport system substrate-binding protein
MRTATGRAARSVAAVAAAGLVLAACSSTTSNGPGSGGAASSAPAWADLSGKHLQVLAEWSGAEQQDFQKVLDAFTAATHATISYQGAGDNTPTVLQSKIAGGAPPDVALLAQPGVIKTLAQAGSVKPFTPDVVSEIDADYDPGWKSLGTVGGQVYSIVFKAANKSTFWYNTAAFAQAGIQPPKTWQDLLKDAQALSDAGVTPISIGGADGWTLTDWFENVYLSQAGPAMYDKLTHHQIPWTDPSVIQALTTLGQLFGDQKLIAGGDGGALQTTFNDSVTQTFTTPPKAAMVYEGDFSSTVITSTTKAKLGTDAKFFPFPAAGSTTNFVTGGGDAAIALNDNPATMELIKFLASPQADVIWAGEGGFLSPNKLVPISTYPDQITQQEATMLQQAGPNFRFDMSDQAPGAFGGTKGAGEWKDLQDFLANPSDVQGTAKQLEADASKASWS